MTSTTLLESIEIAKTLKQQNEQLKTALDDLKKEYLNLKKQYQFEIESKKSLEIDCQNLYKKWNDELKIQAQEFEKIQSEMISNTELQILRVEIIRELEISYNEKLNFMKQEMEKYHKLYTTTFGELEIMKINYKNSQNSIQDLINQETEHLKDKITKLKHENNKLKQEVVNNHNSHHNNYNKQELQAIKLKNIKCNQQIESLIKTNNLLKDKNSKLNLENEELKCENIKNIQEYKQKVLLNETEHNALKRNYHDLHQEFQVNKENYLLKENELQKLVNNEKYLNQTIQAKKEEISNLNESFHKKEKQIKQQFTSNINVLNEKLVEMENNINLLNTDNKNLKLQITNLNNKHLMETQQIKQENFTNFNNLIQSKQEMEENYQETKSNLLQLQTENSKTMDHLNRELEKKTIQTQQIEKEKVNLMEMIQAKQAENEELQNDIKCIKSENVEINNQYQLLTNKYRDILDTNYKLSSKENKYLTQIEFLENDIKEINKKIDDKMREMNENKENDHKSISKLKKEKQKYKKLATMTKLKVNTLSKELNNIKRNFQTELRSKSLEITSLNKQIHEIERQRDEIKFRLTMDSTNTISPNPSNLNKDLITNNVDILLKELEIEQKQIQLQESET